MPQQPKQPTHEQQKQIKKAKLTLWLGIFFIIIVGLAVAVYFVFLQSEEGSNINTMVDTNSVSNANIEIDISDWSTYENAEYGFQFQYPKDWQLNEATNHCPYNELNDNCTNDIVILNPSSGISVYVLHQGKNLEHSTIEEWLIQNQRKQYDEKFKIKTSDIGKITLSELTPGLYQGVVSVDFTEGEDVFEIEWYDSEKNNEQDFLKFQQVVLSLNFSSSIDCDQITDGVECRARADCLYVDFCQPNTDRNRAIKCGDDEVPVGSCVAAGFDYCEDLVCGGVRSTKIFNGSVLIECETTSDCTFVDSTYDYSECCGPPPACTSDYDNDEYVVVNKKSLIRLKADVRGTTCEDVICSVYDMPACPDVESKYIMQCVSGFCTKVFK